MREKRRSKVKFEDDYPRLNPDIAVGSRCKGKRRPMLTVDEKIEIIHKVYVAHEYMKDVAKQYRVGISVVQSLVSKARTNPGFVDDLAGKGEE